MAGAGSEEAGWIRSVQRGGDRAAAELLVRAYYSAILRYLERQVRDRPLAEDLAQEVFIAALRHIGGFDASRASFRTWLYRIATNKVIDDARSRARRGVVVSAAEIELADGVDPAELAVNVALAGRAVQVLSGFPFRSQQVVRLKLFEGGTFAEIGVVLGLPEATVKSVYYRALAAVREELTSDGS